MGDQDVCPTALLSSSQTYHHRGLRGLSMGVRFQKAFLCLCLSDFNKTKKKKNHKDSKFERVTESSMCWFTPKIGARARTVPGQSQAPGYSPASPTRMARTKYLGRFVLLSQVIRKQLDGKLSSQVTKLAQLYGMLESQAVA